MRIMLSAFVVLAGAFGCGGVTFGETLTVDLGSVRLLTSSAEYGSANVQGVLNVSTGANVDVPGVTTLGGSATTYAEINVTGNGTSYGNKENGSYTLGSAVVGAGGTLGRITVGTGAYAEIYSIAFAADAAADPTSGTIDFLDVAGQFRCHDWQVPVGKTVRLRFTGGHLRWGQDWNKKPFANVNGKLIFEAVNGNPVDLRCYGGGVWYFNHNGEMAVVGTGDAILRAPSASVGIYNHKIAYDNDGFVRIKGGTTLNSNQYAYYSMFGEHSQGLVLEDESKLSLTPAMSVSNFSPRNVDATNGTIVVSDASASYTWLTGRWNYDGFFRASLPHQITLVKKGTGTTTVDAPSSAGNLTVEAGKMRFTAPFSCGTLTLAAGTTLEIAAKVSYTTLVDNGGTVRILDGGEWKQEVAADVKQRDFVLEQGAFVKSGPGTLTLYNPSIAAGATLHVAEGALDFSAVGRTEKFWKLTIKEMNTNYSTDEKFCRIADIIQFGPGDENSEFSSASNAVNKALAASNATSPDKLPAGSAMFCCPVTYGKNEDRYQGVEEYFEHNYGANHPWLATPLIDPADPTTYLVVAWRLADDARPVVGYDFLHPWNCNRPKGWVFECSDDGVNWVEADVQTAASAASPNYMYRGFRTWNESRATCAFKLPLTYVASGATGVAGAIGIGVDAGATLDFSRMAAPVAVDRLVIDAEKGFGVLANAAFAAVGTIEVENVEGDIATYNFPMALTNVTGGGNLAKWSLLVNGEPVSRRSPGFRKGECGGTLFFRRPEFTVFIR